MRFVSYEHNTSRSWGALEADHVIDLSHIAESLKVAIQNDALPTSISDSGTKDTVLSIDDVKLLPPIPDPQRILCVGQNYAAHRDEMGGASTSHPLIFTRYASSLVAHDEAIIKPAEANNSITKVNSLLSSVNRVEEFQKNVLLSILPATAASWTVQREIFRFIPRSTSRERTSIEVVVSDPGCCMHLNSPDPMVELP